MHTPLCGHAVGHPMEYALAAKEKGIDLITITCHIPMDWEAFGQAGIRMPREDLNHYMELVQSAVGPAKDFGVEVLCGIEAEVFPDETHMASMDLVLNEYPFDFVLGSMHAHCRSFAIWCKQNKVKTDALKIDSYFRMLIDGVHSGRYDSMSHPDVIRTYGVVEHFNPLEHEEVIRDFLEALVEADVCMEVNTSGLTKGDFEVQPDPIILDWASALGVKLTIGSDSHRPGSVGQFFDSVLPMLHSMGFRKLHYFRKRKRIAIDLPQSLTESSV
jgi:histidinol-phosphatase (PHP family)